MPNTKRITEENRVWKDAALRNEMRQRADKVYSEEVLPCSRAGNNRVVKSGRVYQVDPITGAGYYEDY